MIDISDPLLLLGFLFLGGPPPADPGPGSGCGLDTDPVGDPADLGCELYEVCP